MSEQSAPPMSQPTAEHVLLKEHAGNWSVSCKFYMDASQPPMEAEATEKIEMIGEFWTVSKYETKFMGAPFVGSATMGYEPHTGKFVSTWIDCMSPVLCTFSGKLKGDTIHLEGTFFSCMANTVLKHRATEKHISRNERLFEMFCTLPDGNEIKIMSTHYRRA